MSQSILRLRLKRFHFGKTYTVGRLHIDDEWAGYILEDQVREIPTRPVQEWKVYGKTAIPMGTYEVTITMSQRFKRPLPLVINVPGFEGIRIHPGNTSADTDGCLLPGLDWAGEDFVGRSRVAFSAIYGEITHALGEGRKVFLEVE